MSKLEVATMRVWLKEIVDRIKRSHDNWLTSVEDRCAVRACISRMNRFEIEEFGALLVQEVEILRKQIDRDSQQSDGSVGSPICETCGYPLE